MEEARLEIVVCKSLWEMSGKMGHVACGCEWRYMIAVAMNITTKRLIIHEAESTHKYHHKHPLESFRNP